MRVEEKINNFLKKKNWISWIWLFFLALMIFGKRLFFVLAIVAMGYYFYKKYFNNFKNKKMNMKEKIFDATPSKNPIDFKKGKKMVVTSIAVILLLWLFFASIVIVDAGQTGVYSLFGKVRDAELSSGFHLVNPLGKVTKLSVRTEEYTMSVAHGEGQRIGADAIKALTKEGLSVDLDITVLYRLDEIRASDVYREVGLSYSEKIIRPAIRTSIRDVVAQYEAKDIYSEKRGELAVKITEGLNPKLKNRGIILEEVLMRNVKLPDNLEKSIQDKLQAEQEAQKYDFLLEKERKEKERKVIEAEGQRDAQKIINESLSSNYLYYLYIRELKDREGTIYVPTNPNTGMPTFKELGR